MLLENSQSTRLRVRSHGPKMGMTMRLQLYFFLGLSLSLTAICHDTTYTVTDLGPVPGHPEFQTIGTSVNSQGDVVGIIYSPRRSFVWTAEERVITMLEPPPQYSPSQPNVLSSQWEAIGIDDFGGIYGNILSVYNEVSLPGVTRSQPLGLFWSKDAPASPMILTGLPLHPAIQAAYGWSANLIVADSNNNGLAAGSALWSRQDWDPNPQRVFTAPVAWQGTAIVILQPAELGLTEQWEGSAAAISDDGHIVGNLTRWMPGAEFSESYIFLSYNGLPATRLIDTTNFYPIKINNNGEVIGGYTAASSPYGYRYWSEATSFVEMGWDWTPYAMNNLGQVVGTTWVFGASGVIWHYDPETGEGVRQDLNTLIAPGSGFTIVEARGINDDGLIVGQAWVAAESRYHAVLLTPGSPQAIAVDANRDGEITFDGADETTKEKPFRFWVNDNVDTVLDDVEQDANPARFAPDYSHTVIINERDLEDFTRVRIKTPADLVYDGSWKVSFQFTDVKVGNPGINLWWAPDDSLDYLSDDVVSGKLINKSDRKLCSVGVSEVFLDIDPSHFNVFAAFSGEQADLLFEGNSVGSGALTVRFYRAGVKVVESKTYLALSKITMMYEHWTVGDTADPGVLADNIPLLSSLTEDSQAYVDESPEEKDYILFVHGWRLQPWERRAFANTAFKRLWHLGYKGRFGLYSWPTEWNPGRMWDHLIVDRRNYNRSEEKAWNSAVGLQDRLYKLNKQYPGRVRIFAHSMGNVVVGEALLCNATARQEVRVSPLVATYVATQAATVAQCYNPFLPDLLRSVREPNWYKTYPITDDRHPASGTEYFRGMGVSGRMVNFFNEADFALAQFAWGTNQALKPERGYRYVRLPFSSGNFYHNATRLVVPARIFEIFAHADPARSLPLGRQRGIGDSFSDEVDLQTEFGFGSGSYEHSAEFLDNLRTRRDYWLTLRDQFLLPRNNPN